MGVGEGALGAFLPAFTWGGNIHLGPAAPQQGAREPQNSHCCCSSTHRSANAAAASKA